MWGPNNIILLQQTLGAFLEVPPPEEIRNRWRAARSTSFSAGRNIPGVRALLFAGGSDGFAFVTAASHIGCFARWRGRAQ